jgi:hypothetical protein
MGDKSAETGSQDRTGRTGRVVRTVLTGQGGRTAMTGKIQRTVRKDWTGQLGQDNQDRTTIAGHPGKDS